MKKLLSILLLTMAVSCFYAQEFKGFFSISAGFSMPVQDYSFEYNVDDLFAKTGPCLDLSFGYLIGRSRFGLSATIRSMFNGFNADALTNLLNTQNSNLVWQVQSDPYRTNAFMLGGYASFLLADIVSFTPPQILNKIHFQPRALIGVANSVSPENHVAVFDRSIDFSAVSNRKSATTTSFAYLLGAGFKFEISDRIGILADFDYFESEPKFKNVEFEVFENGNLSDVKLDSSYLISTVNITIGMCFNF
ncbi:MAG: hypothetical protein ACXITV_06205 [Luteibaculaceae bacterium]